MKSRVVAGALSLRGPWFKTASFGETLIIVILALGMTQGMWIALGMPESISKAVIEISILILFAYVLIRRIRTERRLNGKMFAIPLILAILCGLISGIANNSSLFELVFYARFLILPLFFLIGVLNLHFDKSASLRFVRLITLLILLQIPFFVYKFIVIGVDEKFWIGALSHSAGQIGLIFPLLVLSILVPLYFAASGWHILLIIIFSFFPVISEKRAVVVMLPLFFLGATFVYKWLSEKTHMTRVLAAKFFFAKNTSLFFVCLIVWGGSVTLIPSFQYSGNGSHIEYLIQYSKEYLTRDWSSPMNFSKLPTSQNTNVQLGRIAIMKESVLALINKGPTFFLFGMGAGAVNPSPNLGHDRSDIMYVKYGIRGTYSLGLMLLWEGGLVAVIAVAVFFFRMLLAIQQRIEKLRSVEEFLLGSGVFLMVSVLAFDFFFYSTTSWLTHTVAPLVFTLSAIFLNDEQDVTNSYLIDAENGVKSLFME